MKKILAFVVALVMCFQLMPVGAYVPGNADKLNALGLFKGTGNGYQLENTATRIQGLIMLTRLLGEEKAALNCTLSSPFTDVPSGDASRYVAYAYSKGYTTGTSKTEFSPNKIIGYKDYVTFLLRALGYDDKKGEFSYANCLQKAVDIGLMKSQAVQTINSKKPTFRRGDMVDLSVSALKVNVNKKGKTLAEVLVEKGVFTRAAAEAQGVLKKSSQSSQSNTGGQTTNTTVSTDTGKTTVNTTTSTDTGKTNTTSDSSTISRTTQTYKLPSGNVTADVVVVNLKNPKVKLSVKLAGNKIGASSSFSDIVSSSGADVVINANFFESYSPVWYPVGHVMINGEFAFGSTGRYAFGFTESGSIRVGKPAIFFYVKNNNKGYRWACYELNTGNQTNDNSVLYNRYAGSSVNITNAGTVVTVTNGKITNVSDAVAGSSVSIPSNGFVMYFGNGFKNSGYYNQPVVGDSVTLAPELFVNDAEGFTLSGVKNLVSGGPRLVKGGQIYNTVDPEYSEARFTSMVTTRTAIGKKNDGKLVIVSTSAASIKQLGELMHTLGCVDAINLDGGGSTAFAYKGSIVRSPGRKLTTTIHIDVN